MIRRLSRAAVLVVVLIVSAPVAWASIGQPLEELLSSLGSYEVAERGDGWYLGPDGFAVGFDLRGGLVYRVLGQGTLEGDSVQFASDVLGAATGYGAALAEPLVEFFQGRVVEFVGQGPVQLGVELYVLQLEVTQAETGQLALIFTLMLQEVDQEAFPQASYALGPEDARYVIREFSDFQCPFCANYALVALPAIKEQLLVRGDVRFEYHHFPLRSIHPNATAAAVASECVGEVHGPEAFWSFHDALFDRQSSWSDSTAPGMTFAALAEDLKLGGEEVTTCIGEGRFAGAVESAYQAARALQLAGTPTVFVGGFRLQDFLDLQAYLQLFTLIDAFWGEE